MKDATAVIAVAAVAALGYLAWRAHKTGALATTLNPASRDNAVYQAVNTVGGSLSTDGVTGWSADGKWSFGAWLYDVTHPAIATARDNWNASDAFRASERATRAVGGVTGVSDDPMVNDYGTNFRYF